MKKGLFILGPLALLLLGGCRARTERRVEAPSLQWRDSVRVEYRERTRIDTVRVEVALPMESLAVMTRDTVSRLRTSAAESEARIDTAGVLHHSLRNLPLTLTGEAAVAATDTERQTERGEIREVGVPYPVTEYVERDFTLWERVRLEAFWWLMGLLGCAVAWILRWPLMKLIRK